MWRTHRRATRLAGRLFSGSPVVRSNGRQYLVSGTPFGLIELIRLPDGATFLAAAEKPPAQPPPVDPAALGRELAGHLERSKLLIWRTVPGGTVCEALLGLAEGGDAPPAGRPAWSPFACGLGSDEPVIGEARRRAVRQLAGLIEARGSRHPVPALSGHPGAGRRTLAVAAAASVGLRAVELPLSRLLVDRVLSTPIEAFVDAALSAASGLARDELLVVSGGDLLLDLTRRECEQAREELSRLPRVLLVNSGRMEAADIVTLRCPGLAGAEEALELVRARHPELEVERPVPDMLARAAEVPRAGVIPGRVLYLVNLALALRRAGSPDPRLLPDDLASAVSLASSAWGAGGTAPA